MQERERVSDNPSNKMGRRSRLPPGGWWVGKRAEGGGKRRRESEGPGGRWNTVRLPEQIRKGTSGGARLFTIAVGCKKSAKPKGFEPPLPLPQGRGDVSFPEAKVEVAVAGAWSEQGESGEPPGGGRWGKSTFCLWQFLSL